jgi:hypothetical protein
VRRHQGPVCSIALLSVCSLRRLPSPLAASQAAHRLQKPKRKPAFGGSVAGLCTYLILLKNPKPLLRAARGRLTPSCHEVKLAADFEAMRERVPSPVVMVTDGSLSQGRLLNFDQPQGLLVALRPEEVSRCLQEADAALAQGYHFLPSSIKFSARSRSAR